jgi:hypothetical protein
MLKGKTELEKIKKYKKLIIIIKIISENKVLIF